MKPNWKDCIMQNQPTIVNRDRMTDIVLLAKDAPVMEVQACGASAIASGMLEYVTTTRAASRVPSKGLKRALARSLAVHGQASVQAFDASGQVVREAVAVTA
jgi:hypothetical protein